MLHGHGDDAYRHGLPVRADFSTNVRPDGPPPALLVHLRECLGSVTRYPEPVADSFRAALAAAHGLPVDHVLPANGGAAAIHQIAQAWRGARSVVVTPTFAEYEDAARAHGHALRFVPRAELARADLADADLVWLCAPNNPTGEAWPRDELRALVAAFPRVLFVVDVAYAAFCREPAPDAADLARLPNLLLVGSLTKSLGIPGLRLGHVLAAPPLIARLLEFQVPWAVNALAAEAGRFALAQPAACAFDRDTWLARAAAFSEELATLPGLRVAASATTWRLLELPVPRSAELKRWLLREHGLLVRDAANFRGLDARHVRVATRHDADNRLLLEALRTWLENSS